MQWCRCVPQRKPQGPVCYSSASAVGRWILLRYYLRLCLFWLLPLLTGCVSTVVGTAAGATVAVAGAVVAAPFKIGGAVVDAVSNDEDEERNDEDEDKEDDE